MKKRFLQIVLVAFCAFSALPLTAKADTDYAMPEFDGKDAFVFDSFELKGNGVSKITVINYTEYRGISFEVFVHSATTRRWESLGTANLLAFADRTDVGAKYPNLSKMRYFAIVPAEKDAGNEYLLNPVKKQTRLASAPLYIEVRRPEDGLDVTPKPAFNEPNAYVLAETEFPEDSDENISLLNRTSYKTISMRVFGYHKKELRWIPLGSISATGKKKGVLEMDQYDINKFYYFGFSVNGKKEFAFAFQNKSDDICVTLMDLPE